MDTIIMEEYSGNLLDGNNALTVTILNSIFKNLVLENSVPFIRIGGSNLGTSTFQHTLANVIFSNITVKNTLIVADRYQSSFDMQGITMENIQKDTTSPKEALDLAYSYNWYGGVCFLGANSVALSLQNSNFRNISSHCIGLESSSLQLRTSTFDNTGIISSSSYSQSESDDYNGVSWVIFDGGSNDLGAGYLLIIQENKFIGNTLYPTKGGVFFLEKKRTNILFRR